MNKKTLEIVRRLKEKKGNYLDDTIIPIGKVLVVDEYIALFTNLAYTLQTADDQLELMNNTTKQILRGSVMTEDNIIRCTELTEITCMIDGVIGSYWCGDKYKECKGSRVGGNGDGE